MMGTTRALAFTHRSNRRMTYDRAFTLLFDAGLDYSSASALARDVASYDRDSLRRQLEDAKRGHRETKQIRQRFIQATCMELRQ